MKTDFYFFILNLSTNATMAKNIDALKQEIAELKTQVQTLGDEFRAFKELMVATEIGKAKKPAKEKKPKAEKPEKEKVEKPTQNCAKLSKKLVDELAGKMGALWPEEDKAQTKMKAQFREFANGIPEAAYKTMEMPTIMANFIATFGDATVDVEASAGGGSIKVLSLTDLIDVQFEVVKTAEVGVYLMDDGRVTGPLRDEENEDIETQTYNGKEYDVDKFSGRVYDIDTEEFLGYSRIKHKKFAGLIGDK